jgi:hypothetical protein
MTKKFMSKVTEKRKNGTTADEYTITTKNGQVLCVSITEDYVLVHHNTTFKDISFCEGLGVKICKYNIDATIYQLDLNGGRKY